MAYSRIIELLIAESEKIAVLWLCLMCHDYETLLAETAVDIVNCDGLHDMPIISYDSMHR